MSKIKKKKLTKVALANRCGDCGFLTSNNLGEKICVNIDANKEYDMTDLSENTVCTYCSKDGYICEVCETTLEDAGVMLIIAPSSRKWVYCEECIGKIIKDFVPGPGSSKAKILSNNKVEVFVIST
jgi:hypothetical protein